MNPLKNRLKENLLLRRREQEEQQQRYKDIGNVAFVRSRMELKEL